MPRQPISKHTDKHDLEVAGRAVYAARELARFAAVVGERESSDIPLDRVGVEISGFSEWLDRNLSDDDDREALVAHAVGAQTSGLRKIRDNLIDPTTSDQLLLVRIAAAAGLGRDRFLNLLLTDRLRWRAAGQFDALDGVVSRVFGETWDWWSAIDR